MIDITKVSKFYGMTPQNFKKTYMKGDIKKKRMALAMIAYYLFRQDLIND